MNKFLLSFIVSCVTFVGYAQAYNLQNFWEDMAKDTKKLYTEEKMELKATYFYDVMDKGGRQSKVGASISIVRWKFLSIDPAIIYAPHTSTEKVGFGLLMPISIANIPVGDGKTIKDIATNLDPSKEHWLSRMYAGPFIANDFVIGHFMVGIATGIKF